MNPLLLEILPLVRQGYCCSQLLIHLLLQTAGASNPQLVRAANGLCFGLGGSEGPCGLLTGGACVLGCLAGRGTDEEKAHPSLMPLLNDYQQWFAQRTQNFSGSACFQIMEGLSAETGMSNPGAGQQPDPMLCGDLLAQCWEKIIELLEAYGIPLEPR